MGGVAPNVICITVHLSNCFVLDCGVNSRFTSSRFLIFEQSRMLSLTLLIATST